MRPTLSSSWCLICKYPALEPATPWGLYSASWRPTASSPHCGGQIGSPMLQADQLWGSGCQVSNPGATTYELDDFLKYPFSRGYYRSNSMANGKM